ncbi:MAG TPA: DinB family protein [Terriglobales bacterium]|nr:DinB family protein [Terriglobales bacterium]
MNSQSFNLSQTIALLERTPAALNALLRGLPETWTKTNEGNNTWSPYDIIGHLIFGELTDWLPRARVILAGDETRTFEPFDRVGYKSESEGQSLDWLLDEFARVRRASLSTLRALNLQAQDFSRRARHPALGSVTLSQVLATWAVHDLTHLHQISRVMAEQYRQAVGPWSAFLGVLQCNGHSAP